MDDSRRLYPTVNNGVVPGPVASISSCFGW